jgi:nicotinate-nucleotide adenylyltransferase
MATTKEKTRIAFYGGSFDPVHAGHIAIGHGLLQQFALDQFVFIHAYHAPHKPDRAPTSAFHRYAMLCLATADDDRILVSRLEVELPERPYSVETLASLAELYPEAERYFVMGADSWADIRTWREWERLLEMTNHIVVTRPGYSIETDHVTASARERIVDLRGGGGPTDNADGYRIFFTDIVEMDISATRLRARIRNGEGVQNGELPVEVAKYIEKYQIY